MEDPVALAIDTMLKLNKLINKAKKEVCKSSNETKWGNGIRRRLQNLPMLIASTGLTPSLTFYMSKSHGAIYNLVYSYLEKEVLDEKPLEDNDLRKRFCDELGSKEAAGYNAALAVAVIGLSRLVAAPPSSVSLGDLNGVAKYLLALRSGELGVSEVQAVSLLTGFLEEAKKLAAAFYAE